MNLDNLKFLIELYEAKQISEEVFYKRLTLFATEYYEKKLPQKEKETNSG